MYQYDDYDHQLLWERVAEFNDQVKRYLACKLSDDEFLPLRLQNGLYRQKHAYMLRVAIPYGTLSSTQLRALATIARRYDRGFGHFTTRQNIQFNWIMLEQSPEIFEQLAKVGMHAIQTSGNCVRNITTEQFAGVAADEVVDPRPYAEILRQWSTINPEFLYLPRKFKIAIIAASHDRAVTHVHDIGLQLYHASTNGALMARVLVGGGLGRTPMLGVILNEALPWQHLLTYIEAILRVYNRFGRRDNKYKARIKMLVKTLGIEKFAQEVEGEWLHLKEGPDTLTPQEVERVRTQFDRPAYVRYTSACLRSQNEITRALTADTSPDFARWLKRNVHPHKMPGYVSVSISTKPGPTAAPGDLTAAQMEQVAGWAERYGFSVVRVTHEQNLLLPDVREADLHMLWQEASRAGLATPNIGLITDIIACPGGDFCALANARSLPVAKAIQQRFDDIDFIHDLGDLSVNVSGCINACGHHHIGNIGILGVDKDGEEWYQVTLGGTQGFPARLGKVIGPSFSAAQMPVVVDRVLQTFCEYRVDNELFIETFARIGMEPFRQRVYQAHVLEQVLP